MSTLYQLEKDHALQAVTKAAALCQQVQAEMVSPTTVQKVDRSPVTVADYGSQAVICKWLADAFPNDPVVAEESSQWLRQSQHSEMLEQVAHYAQTLLPQTTPHDVCDWIDLGSAKPASRFWTLDPIDGTKGFLRGEQYAVALALIEEGRAQVGALACPNLPLNSSQPNGLRGVAFLAVRGQGAEMIPLDGGPSQPISVDSLDDPSTARFVESVEAGHADHGTHQALAQALGITQPSLRLDSQAKYGVVARGETAIYLRLPSPKTPHYREKIWDHAAGSLIVQEAGGRVSDVLGNELDFTRGRKLLDNQGVVATNGHLHAVVLDAINSL